VCRFLNQTGLVTGRSILLLLSCMSSPCRLLCTAIATAIAPLVATSVLCTVH
jgi:hypothetical protein